MGLDLINKNTNITTTTILLIIIILIIIITNTLKNLIKAINNFYLEIAIKFKKRERALLVH